MWSVERVMSVVVSLVLLAGALYVVLSGTYDQDTQKWAMGIVGMIVGFWLPSGFRRSTRGVGRLLA